MALAKLFEQQVRQDSRLEVINDVIVGLVCFRIKVKLREIGRYSVLGPREQNLPLPIMNVGTLSQGEIYLAYGIK